MALPPQLQDCNSDGGRLGMRGYNHAVRGSDRFNLDGNLGGGRKTK